MMVDRKACGKPLAKDDSLRSRVYLYLRLYSSIRPLMLNVIIVCQNILDDSANIDEKVRNDYLSNGI